MENFLSRGLLGVEPAVERRERDDVQPPRGVALVGTHHRPLDTLADLPCFVGIADSRRQFQTRRGEQEVGRLDVPFRLGQRAREELPRIGKPLGDFDLVVVEPLEIEIALPQGRDLGTGFGPTRATVGNRLPMGDRTRTIEFGQPQLTQQPARLRRRGVVWKLLDLILQRRRVRRCRCTRRLLRQRAATRQGAQQGRSARFGPAAGSSASRVNTSSAAANDSP